VRTHAKFRAIAHVITRSHMRRRRGKPVARDNLSLPKRQLPAPQSGRAQSDLSGANLASISKARAVARPVAEVPTAAPDNFVSAAKIRKLCGNVSAMTLWRWIHSPKLACPPLFRINGRLYGGERAWLEWRERQRRHIGHSPDSAPGAITASAITASELPQCFPPEGATQ
jgi:hypothetical protein